MMLSSVSDEKVNWKEKLQVLYECACSGWLCLLRIIDITLVGLEIVCWPVCCLRDVGEFMEGIMEGISPIQICQHWATRWVFGWLFYLFKLNI